MIMVVAVGMRMRMRRIMVDRGRDMSVMMVSNRVGRIRMVVVRHGRL